MSTLTTTLLEPTPMVSRSVRAYFAPVTRSTQTPTLFDPALQGRFALDAPPAPWVDLGSIAKFERKSETAIDALLTGSPAVARSQVRAQVDASVSFEFLSWGKLQMALASGSQHMNLLVSAGSAVAGGSGGAGGTAIPVLAGSTATSIVVGSTNAASFQAGEMIAVDVDYSGAIGFVGSGASAAYIASAAAIGSDANYIRRVTMNVARIVSITTDSLTLAEPLLAGAPTTAMKIAPIVGFVDREGGSFFQEWSAVFVLDGTQGDRILFHYPRLQAMRAAGETQGALTRPLMEWSQAASFRALPVVDSLDGESVLCFRSYLPAANTLI